MIFGRVFMFYVEKCYILIYQNAYLSIFYEEENKIWSFVHWLVQIDYVQIRKTISVRGRDILEKCNRSNG